MDAARKRKLYLGVALLLLFVVIVVVLSVRGREVFETMRGLDPKYVAMALLAYAGIQLAWGIKWFLHVRKVVPKAGFLYVLLANITGNFINITTPSGRLAGEPIRAGAVARRYKARFSGVFATTIVDKMGLTAVMILMLIPLLFFAYDRYDMPPLLKYILFVIFLFWIMIGAVSFVIIKSMKRWRADMLVNWFYVVTKFFKGTSPFDRKALTEKLTSGLRGFREAVKELIKDPISMSCDLLLATTMYLLRIAAAYMFFVAVGYHVNFYIVAVAVHITFIIGLSSQLPANVGISELTMPSLLIVMGVSSGPAITVAFLAQMNSYFFELGFGYLSSWAINLMGPSRKVTASRRARR